MQVAMLAVKPEIDAAKERVITKLIEKHNSTKDCKLFFIVYVHVLSPIFILRINCISKF